MDETVEAEADLLAVRAVRSSNGEVESRPVIRTKVVIGGRRFPIELTLTRRDEMGFRMLLGRRALRRRFVIDPALVPVRGQYSRALVAGGPRCRCRLTP